MVIYRKYNTATASGTHIRIPVVKAGSTDFAGSGDWTPATGDVKLSKDGGTQANIGTLPSFTNGAWEFQLTGTELSCKQLEIMIVDSATKAIVDQAILIETFGNASAMYQVDLSAAALSADVTKISGDSTAADNLEAALDGTGGVTFSASLGSDGNNAIADATLVRATSSVTEASAPKKSLYGAIAKLTHKVDSTGGTMTVYRSNGTDAHYTQTESTDSAADPLTGLTGAA